MIQNNITLLKDNIRAYQFTINIKEILFPKQFIDWTEWS